MEAGMESFTPEEQEISLEDLAAVRALREEDLEAIVRIDARHSGRSRGEYLRRRVQAALRDSPLMVSLVVEADGAVAGFLLASLYYGEYGVPEPWAAIDTIGVDPRHAGHGLGRALVHQLGTNLAGLGIERVYTEVEWDQWELLRFLAGCGFRPSARICLEWRPGA